MSFRTARFSFSAILTAAVLACAPVAAMAQAVAGAGAAQSGRAGFSDLARRLSPAVVGISARRDIPGMPRDAAHMGVGQASGSGFLISPDGVIVTNNHVIDGADAFEAVLADGTRLPAVLVGRDAETDLAVLRATARGPLPFVRWGDSDKAAVGDWAIAIGSPFGLGGSLSVGVISGRNRDLQAGRFDDFLQTDAAINRGNSGGPLFDAAGAVIGVNTAIVSPGGPQGGSVGVGFAVPSNLARRVVGDLLASGVVQRGWIGLRTRLLRPDEGRGVAVTEVVPGGPAARGGLRAGDVVTGFAGRPIEDPRALARAVSDSRAGQAVRLTGRRGRQAIFANVTVAAPPGAARTRQAPVADARVQAVAGSLGLVLRGRGRADAAGLPETVRVIVDQVDPFGPARTLVEPGDGLADVQGRPVTSPQEARAALEEAARARDAVVVRLIRDGRSIHRALKPRRR
jgi:serine protease Do